VLDNEVLGDVVALQELHDEVAAAAATGAGGQEV
jgi:hypothetical protein